MRFKQYLTENNLRQYIKGMQVMISRQEDINPLQVAYWQWLEKQGKTVTVQSYRSDPNLEKLVHRNLDVASPKIKECYRNAWMIAATKSREVEVVVGFFSSMGIPIEHAWNYYKPKKIHFDLTYEICLNKKVENETYLQIVKTDPGKATKILTSNEFDFTGFMGLWFHRYIYKGKK
jgi:hypothetical protein